jgi:hypothetical protein
VTLRSRAFSQPKSEGQVILSKVFFAKVDVNKVTKPGKPVIIVYSNPNTFISRLKNLLHFRAPSENNLSQKKHADDEDGYFFLHTVEWWSRFNDVASVKVLPWRSLGTNAQKKLIPDNRIGLKMFSLLYYLEEKYPDFFVKHFSYIMVILTKREN